MIIGLGYEGRSGKDTAASYLVDKYGFIQESFAAPIKEIGRNVCGLNDKYLFGSWKEMIVPEYRMTSRELQQKIGQALREMVCEDFWVINMQRRIREHKNKGNNLIVISDCRHINEASMIKEFGGKMIKTNRINRDSIANPNHISEIEMKNYQEWDHFLDNNGTYEELYAQIDRIMVEKLYNKLG